MILSRPASVQSKLIEIFLSSWDKIAHIPFLKQIWQGNVFKTYPRLPCLLARALGGYAGPVIARQHWVIQTNKNQSRRFSYDFTLSLSAPPARGVKLFDLRSIKQPMLVASGCMTLSRSWLSRFLLMQPPLFFICILLFRNLQNVPHSRSSIENGIPVSSIQPWQCDPIQRQISISVNY